MATGRLTDLFHCELSCTNVGYKQLPKLAGDTLPHYREVWCAFYLIISKLVQTCKSALANLCLPSSFEANGEEGSKFYREWVG